MPDERRRERAAELLQTVCTDLECFRREQRFNVDAEAADQLDGITRDARRSLALLRGEPEAAPRPGRSGTFLGLPVVLSEALGEGEWVLTSEEVAP